MNDLASAILALDDTVYEQVSIPEWVLNNSPVVLTVRSITADETDEVEHFGMVKVKTRRNGRIVEKYEHRKKNLRAKLVSLSVCKAPGDKTPVFSEQDVIKLGKKNAAAIDRIIEVIKRISRIDSETLDEELGKGEADGTTNSG